MNENHQAKVQQFVEEVGIVFEQTGLPRMAGRIFGWLLLSNPPHQSTEEVTEALMASKGSISSMTRLLMQIGLIERFCLPGVRHNYFRIRADAWHHLIGHGLEDEIKMMRQVAEHGIELMSDKTPLSQKWLEEMRDIYVFLEKELPILMERWEREHRERQTANKLSR